ncbi:hypothetical protein Acsp03_69990 [Actinomadura sp. NBRC 104412]|uniref:DUF6907 domain-containing protein n=1 Tax=Actinomadura sp. NBRC 104412 TaxID=3032203 RepID=UPI0024A2129D|nr:hypothetical protein [Actinomadura sp. NBRC 104412]GLZ09533.1 hypothetical protein Acsp03_69990 [Actinomadura sp. NBRC 104412]
MSACQKGYTFDPSTSLDRGQLLGHACARCGASLLDGATSALVQEKSGVQLLVCAHHRDGDQGEPSRPSWLPNGCPPWCGWEGTHKEGDMYEDRSHGGAVRSIVMTAAEPNRGDDQPAMVRACLIQHYREVSPRIEIDRDGDRVGITLTIAEARAFATELLNLVDIAEGPAESMQKRQ